MGFAPLYPSYKLQNRQLHRLPAKRNLAIRVRQSSPTGKSLLIYGTSGQAPESKIFRFYRNEKHGIYSPIPSRSGASAVVTNEGRVAVDAEAATDARGQSVRQRRVVLTPRCWRRRWQQYMAHRGERVISRKAIAQGMSDVLRCPVCSCAHSSCTLRMRSRVQRASGIPCAL